MPPASIHDFPAVDRLARSLRLDPYRLRRLRVAFYKRQRTAAEALAELPAEARGEFQAQVAFHPLELVRRLDSRVDGATKLLFRTTAGHLIETVILRIATGRTTLCVSSQAGCAADCAFCATGKLGLQQQLSAAEILDQVVQAGQVLSAESRRIRNLVFMGMGEPLHNEANLGAALEVLRAPTGFHFEERRLLVSTVGIPDAMRRLVARFPQVSLALSLHAARPEVRERLVPLARRHPLPELRAAVVDTTRPPGRQIMIEYTLIEGGNDGPEDVAALIDWLHDLPAHVNLIPYNPIDGGLRGTPRPRIEAIARELKRHGLKTTIRYSLGADIAAACGTLAGGTAAGGPAVKD